RDDLPRPASVVVAVPSAHLLPRRDRRPLDPCRLAVAGPDRAGPHGRDGYRPTRRSVARDALHRLVRSARCEPPPAHPRGRPGAARLRGLLRAEGRSGHRGRTRRGPAAGDGDVIATLTRRLRGGAAPGLESNAAALMLSSLATGLLGLVYWAV